MTSAYQAEARPAIRAQVANLLHGLRHVAWQRGLFRPSIKARNNANRKQATSYWYGIR